MDWSPPKCGHSPAAACSNRVTYPVMHIPKKEIKQDGIKV